MSSYLFRRDKGSGFIDEDSESIFMVKCFKCGKPPKDAAHYADRCECCGFDPNGRDPEPKRAA